MKSVDYQFAAIIWLWVQPRSATLSTMLLICIHHLFPWLPTGTYCTQTNKLVVYITSLLPYDRCVNIISILILTNILKYGPRSYIIVYVLNKKIKLYNSYFATNINEFAHFKIFTNNLFATRSIRTFQWLTTINETVVG